MGHPAKNSKPKNKCICCRCKTFEVGLCNECSGALFESADYLHMKYHSAIVVQDVAKWYAFEVSGGGHERLRKLRLLAVCRSETEAERAARVILPPDEEEEEEIPEPPQLAETGS